MGRRYAQSSAATRRMLRRRHADHWARADALRCSTRCRVAAHRAAKKRVSPVEPTTHDRCARRAGDQRPLTTTGRAASGTDARTWSTHKNAAESVADVGMGFVLSDVGMGFVFSDVDDVVVSTWTINDGTPARQTPRQFLRLSALLFVSSLRAGDLRALRTANLVPEFAHRPNRLLRLTADGRDPLERSDEDPGDCTDERHDHSGPTIDFHPDLENLPWQVVGPGTGALGPTTDAHVVDAERRPRHGTTTHHHTALSRSGIGAGSMPLAPADGQGC